jgi:alcohol dehydrogenase class IV
VALVDPELTYGLPATVTAATGMDALCHAVEAFTTKNAGPVTDALALRAIELVGASLLAAYRNGADKDARRAVMLGSMTAGMAFPNAGLGAVHGLTAPLGGHFGVPHGVANAILLPVVMEFNRESRRERFGQIGEALGGDPVGRVREMNAAMNIPRLSAFGITEKDLSRLAADALGPNSNCNSNPRPVTLADAKQLLREAL